MSAHGREPLGKRGGRPVLRCLFTTFIVRLDVEPELATPMLSDPRFGMPVGFVVHRARVTRRRQSSLEHMFP
jgi:hypothetical protein